jgi:hypothetical protein
MKIEVLPFMQTFLLFRCKLYNTKWYYNTENGYIVPKNVSGDVLKGKFHILRKELGSKVFIALLRNPGISGYDLCKEIYLESKDSKKRVPYSISKIYQTLGELRALKLARKIKDTKSSIRKDKNFVKYDGLMEAINQELPAESKLDSTEKKSLKQFIKSVCIGWTNSPIIPVNIKAIKAKKEDNFLDVFITMIKIWSELKLKDMIPSGNKKAYNNSAKEMDIDNISTGYATDALLELNKVSKSTLKKLLKLPDSSYYREFMRTVTLVFKTVGWMDKIYKKRYEGK